MTPEPVNHYELWTQNSYNYCRCPAMVKFPFTILGSGPDLAPDQHPKSNGLLLSELTAAKIHKYS